MKRRKISNLLKDIFCFEFFLVLIFMIVSFVMVMNHELWFDEIQAWALAKYLNVFDLIKQMKVEGHSAMWSLFLKLFVNLNLNVSILNFISWMIGIITSMIISYKTKFNKLTKVLILFNIALLYYSTVFARPYSVIFLMMSLLMLFYKDRYNKPLLVGLILLILSNTHLMVMGFMLSLFLIELYGLFKYKDYKKERITLMSFMVFGVLLFFFQVIGAFVVRENIIVNHSISDLFLQMLETLEALYLALFSYPILCFVGIILIMIFILKLYKYKEVFIICFISLLFYFILSSVYVLNGYKVSFIISMLLFCLNEVLRNYNDKKLNKYFIFILLCSLPSSLNVLYDEYRNIVSNSIVVWNNIEDRNDVNVLSLGNVCSFSIYCDECNFYNYYSEKSYKYGEFGTFGLLIFDFNKFRNLVERYDIDYFVLYSEIENVLIEDLNSLGDLITKVELEGTKKCVSDRKAVCEEFSLYKVNKTGVIYEG